MKKKSKNQKYILLLILILNFSIYNILQVNAEDGGEERDHQEREDSRNSKEREDSSESEDDSEDDYKYNNTGTNVTTSTVTKSSNSNSNVSDTTVSQPAPVKTLQNDEYKNNYSPVVIPANPENNPYSSLPGSISETKEGPKESLPLKISDEEIKNLIMNQDGFKGKILNVDLEEVEDKLLGKIITQQKFLGLFYLDIPYEVEINQVSKIITKKSNSILNSFLDFLSF